MSKPVRNYLLMNIIFITIFSCFMIISFAQNQSSSTNDVDKEPSKDLKVLTPEQIKKKEDSLLNVFKKEQEVTLKYLSEYPKAKEKNKELRAAEIKAYEEHIKALNTFLAKQGRNQKVIMTKDIKQQLQEGELEFVKDSVCVNSKKKFLSRKVNCTKYEYHFYLKDNKGKLEKLW